ncbi:hypothetical protein KP79_PYT16138 [Mizuhopecten yessoensis]|uniref:SH3 domain-containing protein n=1 Tax=Mizuhopecten yessoensis TaxID=6573 RepID=A0A210PVB9_MIZYE|nr:hypothetical protein KP79_PYT16138 [Mizuhopecten yessoensis]
MCLSSPRRELVLHQMRSIASGMIEVRMNTYKQWSKEKTRYYNFELFTDDWSHYGLGIVTNNVPEVVIPANLQVMSESDKTDSSYDERSGVSHKDNPDTSEPCDDFHLTEVSVQSNQGTKYGSQRPDRSRRDKQSPQQKEGENIEDPGQDQGAVPKVSRNPGSSVKGQITSPDENVDTPALTWNKTNRRQVGPNSKSLNPPPKSSTDGWRATQTPLGNLTLPVKSDSQTKRRNVNSQSDGLTPVCCGNELTRDRSQQSPVEETNVRSANDTWNGTKSCPSENAGEHLQVQTFTGKDHPYYTPGDPLDLETLVLPEDKTVRPEPPFQPMINNWMDPDIDPLDANSSDHNLLSQFLTRTKSKFRKSKKVKKPKSPEIMDSGPIPFDFGCQFVDEVSTVIEPYELISKGARAPPSTPGPSQLVEKSKNTAQSGSDSSTNANREPHQAKHHSLRVIKLCSIDSYEARNEDEISFVSGQTVKMINNANAEGMAYGYTRSSRMKKREYGFFPVSHVVRVVEDRNRSLMKKVSGFLKKR